MKKQLITELGQSLIKIAWYFGPKGLNGECCDNLTMPEFIALETVSSTSDCPVQKVGYSLGFTKSGATRIVNRLEKKGYVEKIRSFEDARICCVKVTGKGKQILASANSHYINEFNKLVSLMSGYSFSDVAEVVTAMANSIKN